MSSGLDDVAAARETLREHATTEDPAAALAQLLTKHSIVLVGGSARITSWSRREGGATVLELVNEAGFKLFYKHLRMMVPNPAGGNVEVALTSQFFQKASRYKGLVFAPGAGDVVDGKLNMWRGFGVQAAAGVWKLMRAHIVGVLAAGDDELAEYIINWLAWTVQNPGQRAEVALVLRGGKGSGKGTLGVVMCLIFGSHGVHISHRQHLVGGFNMHMAHCSMLFADEAYWPGDKQGEGSLKG
jgi:hypothetical protein